MGQRQNSVQHPVELAQGKGSGSVLRTWLVKGCVYILNKVCAVDFCEKCRYYHLICG